MPSSHPAFLSSPPIRLSSPPRPSRLSRAAPSAPRHARMTLSPPSSASHTASRDISGTPAAAVPDALAAFVSFFDEQSGSWNSQRTYHYLDASSGARDREESATTFDVARLGEAEVAAVLKCNSKEAVVDEELGSRTAGFRVSFLTKMASQSELVRSYTDLAFVPERVDGGEVSGAYYRLFGYEERVPTVATFVFDAALRKLNMTTFYTRTVSVDSIALVNPTCRIRNIINFQRPPDGLPLTVPELVGFGVETKRAEGDAADVE